MYVVQNDGFDNAEADRPLPMNTGHEQTASRWTSTTDIETHFRDSLSARYELDDTSAGPAQVVQTTISNPAVSSPKGASVSNAIQLRIE